MSFVKKTLIITAIIALGLGVGAVVIPATRTQTYIHGSQASTTTQSVGATSSTARPLNATSTPSAPVTHLQAPHPTKALYISSWAAGTPSFRNHIISLIDTTEINALVVDIKDYTGKISFEVNDPTLHGLNVWEKRIPDIDSFITLLHQKGVYVIGRVAVFQDPSMVALHPDWAVKRASDGGIWKDHKGISWIDVSAPGMWGYIASVAREGYARGFDEINFDYIRFPSDGNMRDIAYPYSKNTPKPDALRGFFKYLHDTLSPQHIPISADLFGMTTTNTDDLNIGQVLENALPYFDYIDPMVYPSHYPPTFLNYKNPAEHPYEVVHFALAGAVRRANAASTTPQKIRPWLQDFNLGAVYTADMVRTQIKATYDVGLTSWLLWDAANKYTPAALEKK